MATALARHSGGREGRLLRECSAACKGEELRLLLGQLWSVGRLRQKLMLRLMLEQMLWLLMLLLHDWRMLECSCEVRLS